MSRAFGRCKHCGETLWEPDFSTCSHCACLTAGRWVSSPDGPGEIVQVRHSGGLVVLLKDGRTRQYGGDQLTVQADEPGREPGSDDLEPEPTTAAAPIAVPQPAQELEPPIRADRTTDCRPLPPDPDPLAKIRRALMSRSFPAGMATAGPR